jgi:HSP20 family protein
MAIIKFEPFFHPFIDDEWPELTMTEGLNVYEENGNVFVEASVPGVSEDKMEVTYEDGVLRIKGRSEESHGEKKKNRIIHRMQRISSFDYSTYLPRPIDEKKIEATVENGVLTVKAPIADEAKPKKIPVKTKAK